MIGRGDDARAIAADVLLQGGRLPVSDASAVALARLDVLHAALRVDEGHAGRGLTRLERLWTDVTGRPSSWTVRCEAGLELAAALLVDGREEEAVDVLRQVAAGACDAFGAAHPLALRARHELAVARLHRGDKPEAILEDLEGVHAARLAVMAPGHPELATGCAAIGVLFGVLGEDELGLASLVEAVARAELASEGWAEEDRAAFRERRAPAFGAALDCARRIGDPVVVADIAEPVLRLAPGRRDLLGFVRLALDEAAREGV